MADRADDASAGLVPQLLGGVLRPPLQDEFQPPNSGATNGAFIAGLADIATIPMPRSTPSALHWDALRPIKMTWWSEDAGLPHPLFALLPAQLRRVPYGDEDDNRELHAACVAALRPPLSLPSLEMLQAEAASEGTSVVSAVAAHLRRRVQTQTSASPCASDDAPWISDAVIDIACDMLSLWAWSPPFIRRYSVASQGEATAFMPRGLPLWMAGPGSYCPVDRGALQLIVLLWLTNGVLGADALLRHPLQTEVAAAQSPLEAPPMLERVALDLGNGSLDICVCPLLELLRTSSTPIHCRQQCTVRSSSGRGRLPADVGVFVSHAWHTADHPDPAGQDWRSVGDALTELVSTVVSALLLLENAGVDLAALETCLAADERLAALDNAATGPLSAREHEIFRLSSEQTSLHGLELPRCGAHVGGQLYRRIVLLALQTHTFLSSASHSSSQSSSA